MLSRLRHWPRIAGAHLAAALPSSCALCGTSDAHGLCSGCRASYFPFQASRCTCCGIVMAASAERCGACLNNLPAFDATIVAADYAPPVDQLVLSLKFGNRLELAPLLARMLCDATQEHETVGLPSLLTVVPLGRRRLIERGFNQALEIAKPLALALAVPLDRQLVTRSRETGAQSLLHPDERHRNVSGAFLVPPAAFDKVRGAHVGVVDDVMTTGETLNALAAELKRSGAARVTNLVFARTLPK